MKVSFSIADYTQKRESGFCFENATMNQDMFEKRKPDIVLKQLRVIRNSSISLIPDNSFKLGIVDLVMLNKMLVIIYSFYYRLLLST